MLFDVGNIFGGRRFREPLTLPSKVWSPHAEEEMAVKEKC